MTPSNQNLLTYCKMKSWSISISKAGTWKIEKTNAENPLHVQWSPETGACIVNNGGRHWQANPVMDFEEMKSLLILIDDIGFPEEAPNEPYSET